MNNVVYERIGRVLFQRDNIGTNCNYVSEFHDNDDAIVITTDMEIDFIERGWLGDITYWAANGWQIGDYTCKTGDFTSEPVRIRDALCIRVNVRYEPECPVTWTYTFLKY